MQMPTRSDRSKKKKFRRNANGKAKVVYIRGKTGKHHCALCKGILHGVPHGKDKAQVKKLAKTKRRPTALFAGVLCSKCRAKVAVEAAKMEAGTKKLEEIELRLQNYVKQVKVA